MKNRVLTKSKFILGISLLVVFLSSAAYSTSRKHTNKSSFALEQKISQKNLVSGPDTIFYIGENYINLVFNFKDNQVGHGPVELPPPGDIACMAPNCPGIRCSTTRCKCSDNDTTCGCISGQ